jgi:hypothetical protein
MFINFYKGAVIPALLASLSDFICHNNSDCRFSDALYLRKMWSGRWAHKILPPSAVSMSQIEFVRPTA